MNIATEIIDSYFTTLESSLDELRITTQITNMNETNFRLEHSPQSAYAKKGAKIIELRGKCHRSECR
jgi:hypothetical protein